MAVMICCCCWRLVTLENSSGIAGISWLVVSEEVLIN